MNDLTTTPLTKSTGWRSMNSAPTDGTRVLLRCQLKAINGEAYQSVHIGQWTTSDRYWGVEDCDWFDDAGYYFVPNGWLSLPSVNECQLIEPVD